MKTFFIDIHPELTGVEVTVSDNKLFEQSMKDGRFHQFEFTTNELDAKRLRQFAVKNGNDNNSNNGDWYAHCNGYCMNLIVEDSGKKFSINTCKSYRRNEPVQGFDGLRTTVVKNKSFC